MGTGGSLHEPTVHRIQWVRDWGGPNDWSPFPAWAREQSGQGGGSRGEDPAVRLPANPKDPWEAVTVLDESLHTDPCFDPVEWDGDPARNS